jgi:cytoskeleton-associated protein 5
VGQRGGATPKDIADLLQYQMESNASKDLVANLFSHDHSVINDNVNELTMLSDFYTDLDLGAESLRLTEDETRTIGVANSDLALKYVSIKAHKPQPNLVSECLDVVDAVLALSSGVEYQLTEPEALCSIPTLVHKLRKYLGRWNAETVRSLLTVWRCSRARSSARTANLPNIPEGVRM